MVILPRKNEKDLRDIPEEIRKQTKLVLVDSMDQVLEAALRRKPKPLAPRAAGPERGGGREQPISPAVPPTNPFPPAEQPSVVVQRATPAR
jgi:ATP-dependent Lon protease